MGLAPFPAGFSRVVLVYRLASLVDADRLAPSMLSRAHAWERNGVKVSGLQIDFDASTLKLPRYAEFLAALRAALPRQYELSVTGLADWSTTAPAGDLKLVSGVVDEIDFQMYRGRKPVPNWQSYARSLAGTTKPFRIGLLESMTLPPALSDALTGNPNYRGPVYFVLGESRHDKS